MVVLHVYAFLTLLHWALPINGAAALQGPVEGDRDQHLRTTPFSVVKPLLRRSVTSSQSGQSDTTPRADAARPSMPPTQRSVQRERHSDPADESPPTSPRSPAPPRDGPRHPFAQARRRPAGGGPWRPSEADILGLVRAENAVQGQEFARALKASNAVPLLHVATMKARSDELVRQALRRQPQVRDPRQLRFTPAERARSRQWHAAWLRAVHVDRHVTGLLGPMWRDLRARDQALAAAGVRTAPRRLGPPAPPERVFDTPQPRLLGTRDPARLVSFTQDWRGRHQYARSPSDPPLARLDRKTSSQELAALVERNHGHQRHLRKSWSSEQFETDSGAHKRLHAADDPMATKERALRSGKLYRGHSFSYSGEMTEDNELSKAMRAKEGLPPLGAPEGPANNRQHAPASSAFSARTGDGRT